MSEVSETASETASNTISEPVREASPLEAPVAEAPAAKKPQMSDGERFKQAYTYHGLAAIALFAVWMAADTWYVTTGLLLANVMNVVIALVAGAYLSGLFHEWGHFTGARMAKAYSPMARQIRGVFMFGFDFDRNNSQQFLSMSMGGPIANWLLVLLVLVLIPIDSAGRAALLAMVTAKAISVCLFEVPVIMAVRSGAAPRQALDDRLDSGALDKSQVFGYLAGAVIWLVAI